MRRYLIRILVFLLTSALGITLAMSWSVTTSGLSSSTPLQPPLSGNFDLSLPIDQQDFDKGNFGSCPGREPIVVMSVPNDDEIYIGKEKVTLSEIPNNLIYKVNGQFPCKVIYIKAADFVKYRTLVSIVDRIREVGANRIGLRRGKKIDFKRRRID